jgi:hypothetical protein
VDVPLPLGSRNVPGLTYQLLTSHNCNSESESESESELLYDWRFTAIQFVLATSPLRLTTSNFIFQLNTCGYSAYVTSSLTKGWVCRLQLLLVLARSESRGTHDPDSRLPQPGGSGPRKYIPQEQDGAVIPPSTGFPFRRLLPLAGLRWRYSKREGHVPGSPPCNSELLVLVLQPQHGPH